MSEPAGTAEPAGTSEQTGTVPAGHAPGGPAPAGGDSSPEAAADPAPAAQDGTSLEPPEPGQPASGTIHVPQQPMRAPVPAPSPHFDRLRSTPAPPEDDAESES